LALSALPGIGSRRLATLISRFGNAESVLAAPAAEIRELDGFSDRAARVITRLDLRDAEQMISAAELADQRLLIPADNEFPARLRSIPDPPPVLFTRGDLGLLDRPAVAIVGSRNHTRYGAEVAADLAHIAVRAGAVVVSGMALGLDAVAHLAALVGGGTTIGVLGSAVDVVYPAANRKLFERVRESGLLVSELPPGSRPHPGSFPRRNRLISGLAQALVVVEAKEGSGTLITVNCALEQGRDVLAVPGPITSPTSRGTNRLLRDGAIPILDPEDLLRALGIGETSTTASPELPCNLSPEEAQVLAVLDVEARHIDEIALAAGIPIGTLLGVLLGLELGGQAEQLPGSQFRRRAVRH